MSNNDVTITLAEPVIDHSLWLLSGRTQPGDTAHGIVAAMRRVRCSIDETGGSTLTDMLDSAIRDRLIIRNLRRRRAGEKIDVAHLPPGGPSLAVAEMVMVTAAETCMAYAEKDPDLGGLMVVALILLDRLIETLGEAPSHEELLDRVRQPALPLSTEELELGEARVSIH